VKHHKLVCLGALAAALTLGNGESAPPKVSRPAKARALREQKVRALRGRLARWENRVSLAALVANPKAHHDKPVWVDGFVTLEYEGNAVYLHETDARYGMMKNGVWLSLAADAFPAAKASQELRRTVHRHYCSVYGTFDATRHGQFDSWSGEIRTKPADIVPLRRWY
jgi:hypothetical protein